MSETASGVLPQGMVMDFENGGEVTVPAVGADYLLHPEDNPAGAAAINAALMAPDEVRMPDPTSGYVTLSAGFVDTAGTVHRTAVVRALKGRDEEAMARALAANDLTRFVDVVLNAATLQVGPASGGDIKNALDTLLAGDRMAILTAIRVESYGRTIELDVVCPHCRESFKVSYDFVNDVPTKDFTVGEPAQRTFSEVLSSGSEVVYRLLDGRAQKVVFTPGTANKTVPELNTLMLTELIETLDGKPVRGPGPVLDMLASDRREVMRSIEEFSNCGPQYDDVQQECPNGSCLRSFPLVVDVRSMFRSE